MFALSLPEINTDMAFDRPKGDGLWTWSSGVPGKRVIVDIASEMKNLAHNFVDRNRVTDRLKIQFFKALNESCVIASASDVSFAASCYLLRSTLGVHIYGIYLLSMYE
jgi:hypothetical protein